MPSPVMSTSNRNDDHPTSVAVSTVGLRKTYGDKTVLDGIDLTVPAGTIFSLLGPNGAGKTTVVNILSTLISADGGQARIDGYDITGEAQAVRGAIGVTGQFSAVDGLITGEENILTEGIMARFRTMAISRASVLIGHVIGSVIQTMMALVLVLGIGLAIGFRPDASPVEWIAAAGLMALVSLALTWLAVGIGLISPNPEGASNIGTPLVMLPFLSSAFVPVDAMPGWFRWFAEYQPFSPAIETLRGLLLGTEIGTKNALLAVGWCLAMTVLGYLWSKAKFNRDPK